MHKNIIYLAILSSVSLLSCNLEQKSYTAEIARMEDTLFKAFPTVNRVSIEVKNDLGTEINITLGDAELYNADDAARQKVVDETGNIIAHVFGPDKTPGKGKVIFVEEENTIHVNEDARKVMKLQLDDRK